MQGVVHSFYELSSAGTSTIGYQRKQQRISGPNDIWNGFLIFIYHEKQGRYPYWHIRLEL